MVLVFCISYYGDMHLLKVSKKYLNSRHIYYRNHYFQCSKGHNTKSRLSNIMVLVFLCSAPRLMILYICVKFYQIARMVFNLQS